MFELYKSDIFLNILKSNYKFTIHKDILKNNNLKFYSYNCKNYFNSFFNFHYDDYQEKSSILKNWEYLNELSKINSISFRYNYISKIGIRGEAKILSNEIIFLNNISNINDLFSNSRKLQIKRKKSKLFKYGCKILKTKETHLIKEFYKRYSLQSQKIFKIPFHKYDFIASLIKEDIADLLILKNDNEIISAIVLLKDKIGKHYFVSYRKRNDSLSSIDVLLDYAINESVSKKELYFNFGATSLYNNTLLTYKESFGCISLDIFQSSTQKIQTYDITNSIIYKRILFSIIPNSFARFLINKYLHKFLF